MSALARGPRETSEPDETTLARQPGLDLLRGLAALLVVIFHFASRVDLGGWFAHGYLAVDFFFCLSGFVIERAYGRRISDGTLSFRRFVRIRLIRFLPMVVLGTLAAAAIDLFRPVDVSFGEHGFNVLVCLLLGCLLLPVFWPTSLEQTTFPLNGPIWSLSFELMANLIHFAVLRSRFGRILPPAIFLASAGFLVLAMGAGRDLHLFGTVNIEYLSGIPRVLCSYMLGVMLARTRIRVPKCSVWIYAGVLVATLSVPALTGAADSFFDLVAILLVMPPIVLGAAQQTVSLQTARVCAWFGAFSYPLYAVHYGMVRVLSAVIRSLDAPLLANLCLVVLATAVLAWISWRLNTVFDVPVRQRLTRWLKSRAASW